MLYASTRSKEGFTAYRALNESFCPYGGQYLPYHPPRFSEEEIAALGAVSFNQIMVNILNPLFGTKLSAWDLDFAIGRKPVRLTELGHKIHIGECWHNPKWSYERLEQGVLSLLREAPAKCEGEWPKIAIRIAVLFGLYGQLLRDGTVQSGETVDISVVSGEFSAPISAWYARQWGLPIANIICCCNENSGIWNLICHGQMRTDTVALATATPEADVTNPRCLERLIHSCGGEREVERYLQCCRKGAMYLPPDWMIPRLQQGLFVSVVSSQRTEKTIPGVLGTHGYLLTASGALAYAGLLDYRAKKGQLRRSIVLTDRSPRTREDSLCRILGIPKEELREIL